jgi:Domain of unknown function (DUF4276)
VVTVKVYVEGGGDHNKALQTECRRGFSKFLQSAGLDGRMPKVIACGGRRQAYDSFRTSHENRRDDEFPVLLVDSEAEVNHQDAWDHVRTREGDGWQRPQGATSDQLHLMVQAMEAWFHADKDTLREYYGHGFRAAALSPRLDVENISKFDLFTGLRQATAACQKGEYSKGAHSFQILAQIVPERIRASSPKADRLLDVLDRVCVR